MDENVAEFLRRSILKIPLHAIKTILKTWDFLSENQLETINLRQRKESLAQEIILLCEGKNATLDDMALLDIVYTQVHRHKKLWDVFEMSKEPGEDVDLFDMKQFQGSFKKILQRALKNALKIASKHHQMVHLNLRSRHLDSLKAIVFREYNQNFDSHSTTVPLQEESFGLDVNLDSNIILENTEEKERIQRVTQETFGTYSQPQLEFAQYKLETRFKSDISGGILADRKEPLRCLVKFSSPHLLEALKSLAPAGIADAPLSPLLTCIPSKKMNYFKIRDK
ncbi:centromere protein N isoform X2 [Chionomys nivalis]|uniref:centromere protein N isoform X2 n=1 Tax=Chionomys nivalis TaxID=269649 RepID=UPI0025915F7D|nr:centromere protein N isoform X2 [Chionomys nivalis]